MEIPTNLPAGLSEETMKLLEEKKTNLAIIKVLCAVVCFLVASVVVVYVVGRNDITELRKEKDAIIAHKDELLLQAVKDNNEDSKELIRQYRFLQKFYMVNTDEDTDNDITNHSTPRKSR